MSCAAEFLSGWTDTQRRTASRTAAAAAEEGLGCGPFTVFAPPCPRPFTAFPLPCPRPLTAIFPPHAAQVPGGDRRELRGRLDLSSGAPPSNQPQVLHTSTCTFTDKTCLTGAPPGRRRRWAFNVTNQPQVLHTPTGTLTDRTCLMPGPPGDDFIVLTDGCVAAYGCSPYGESLLQL